MQSCAVYIKRSRICAHRFSKVACSQGQATTNDFLNFVAVTAAGVVESRYYFTEVQLLIP